MLLIIPISNAFAHGPSETTIDSDKSPIIIPRITSYPKIDGIVNEIDFPEDGHVDFGLLDEVKFSHNGTALFISITVDTEEFVGIAIQNRGENNQNQFVYFLAGINSNQSVRTVRVADSDYSNIQINSTSTNSFFANVTENEVARIYELMIPIKSTQLSNTDANEGIEALIPELGSSFNLMVITGEGEEIYTSSVEKSSISMAYLLRQGENSEEIEKLLDNDPSWLQAIVFPLVLFILSVFFVWKYRLVEIGREN